MSDAEEACALEKELKALMREWIERYSISTTPVFLDLVWDQGMTEDEMFALDRPVVIYANQTSRQLVIQRIRGELRYWLATHRDPMILSTSGKDELGVVGSVEDAVELIEEFLNSDRRIADLQTPRSAGGIRRGRSL